MGAGTFISSSAGRRPSACGDRSFFPEWKLAQAGKAILASLAATSPRPILLRNKDTVFLSSGTLGHWGESALYWADLSSA